MLKYLKELIKYFITNVIKLYLFVKKQNANNSLVFKLNVILLFFLTQLLVYIDDVNSVFVMYTQAGKLIDLDRNEL